MFQQVAGCQAAYEKKQCIMHTETLQLWYHKAHFLGQMGWFSKIFKCLPVEQHLYEIRSLVRYPPSARITRIVWL